VIGEKSTLMIKAVIFDIGGVLACDVWENLFLDKDEGIVAKYGLDYNKVLQVGQKLWDIYSHRSTNDHQGWRELEREYWGQVLKHLNIKAHIDDLIELSDQFIKPAVGMGNILERLYLNNTELAILSNNTEFWFERQMDKLGYRKYIHRKKSSYQVAWVILSQARRWLCFML